MTLTFGYDISEHQRTVPVIESARFAVCRATYGLYTDARVRAHIATARALGELVGLYAFGVRTDFRTGLSVGGRAQAEALLRLAEELHVDRIALDYEDDGPTRRQMPEDEALAFIEKVRAEHGDCGLYASAYQFADFGQTWDWVARWGTAQPSWHGWELWQDASNYRGRNLDTNWFNGDEAALRTFFTTRGAGVPKPEPRPVDQKPEGEDEMFNIGPSSTERDARLRPGTVLYRDSALTKRISRTEEGCDLGFIGSGKSFHAVVNGGRVQYVSRGQVETTSIANVRHYQ